MARGTPARRVLLAGAALALIGTLRGAYLHFVSEPLWRFEQTRPALVDDRYAPLRSGLPSRGVVGYRCDSPRGSDSYLRRYTQALYSLAPLVLVADDGKQASVLVDADQEAQLPSLIAAAGPSRVVRSGPSVALISREQGHAP